MSLQIATLTANRTVTIQPAFVGGGLLKGKPVEVCQQLPLSQLQIAHMWEEAVSNTRKQLQHVSTTAVIAVPLFNK